MKKANSIIIATIIATFVISMFAFQPTAEAVNSVLPNAAPTPRKIKSVPNLTKRKTTTGNLSAQYNPKEVWIERIKKPRNRNGASRTQRRRH